ncbi:MAG: hypothetical protein BGO21_19800 [Dyadobacter sp. 50-39]|nr:MAG: hypothetical protein BGO21_19800 [Dyadobacter sp. 50-39]
MIPIIYGNLTMDKSSTTASPTVSTFVQTMGINVQKGAKSDGFRDKVAFNPFFAEEKNRFPSSL